MLCAAAADGAPPRRKMGKAFSLPFAGGADPMFEEGSCPACEGRLVRDEPSSTVICMDCGHVADETAELLSPTESGESPAPKAFASRRTGAIVGPRQSVSYAVLAALGDVDRGTRRESEISPQLYAAVSNTCTALDLTSRFRNEVFDLALALYSSGVASNMPRPLFAAVCALAISRRHLLPVGFAEAAAIAGCSPTRLYNATRRMQEGGTGLFLPTLDTDAARDRVVARVLAYSGTAASREQQQRTGTGAGAVRALPLAAVPASSSSGTTTAPGGSVAASLFAPPAPSRPPGPTRSRPPPAASSSGQASSSQESLSWPLLRTWTDAVHCVWQRRDPYAHARTGPWAAAGACAVVAAAAAAAKGPAASANPLFVGSAAASTVLPLAAGGVVALRNAVQRAMAAVLAEGEPLVGGHPEDSVVTATHLAQRLVPIKSPTRLRRAYTRPGTRGSTPAVVRLRSALRAVVSADPSLHETALSRASDDRRAHRKRSVAAAMAVAKAAPYAVGGTVTAAAEDEEDTDGAGGPWHEAPMPAESEVGDCVLSEEEALGRERLAESLGGRDLPPPKKRARVKRPRSPSADAAAAATAAAAAVRGPEEEGFDVAAVERWCEQANARLAASSEPDALDLLC